MLKVTTTQQADQLPHCQQLFYQFNQEIVRQQLSDAQVQPLPGKPHLASNRFLAWLAHQARDRYQQQYWLLRSFRLAQEKRIIELSYSTSMSRCARRAEVTPG